MSRRLLLVLVAAAALAAVLPGLARGAAVPSIRVEGPAEVGQGEAFTVSVFLENVGDSDGALYVVDIETPASVELRSAGFSNTVSRGASVTLDSSGRAVHPLYSDGGRPEIVQGRPGSELWVSYDQLNQTAFAGAVNRLDAEFVMAKDARPGRPVKIRFRGGFLRSSPGGGPVVTGWRTLRVTPTAVTLAEVAQSLASDPVFVAASADPGIEATQEKLVESAVADAATPISVAVLPASAGSPETVLDQLVRTSGLGGTFVVLVGERYRATSDRIPQADLDRLLEEAVSEDGAEPLDVLRGLVRRLDAYVEAPGGEGGATTATGTTAGEEADAAPGGGADGGASSSIPWIVTGAVVGGIAVLVLGSRALRALGRRRRERRRLAELRETAEDERTALGEEIADLDLDVEMPGVPSQAKEDYGLALAAYEESGEKLPRAEDAEELRSVAETIALGRQAMASAKARLAAPEKPPSEGDHTRRA